MLVLYVTVLLTTGLQTEIQGWSHRSQYLGRKTGEIRSKADSYNVILPNQLERRASMDLKKVMEVMVNRTRRVEGNATHGSQPAFSRKFSEQSYPATYSSVVRPTASSTDMPPLQKAKKFWNHFVFRRRSDFQSIIPLRNNEVHQEKCRAIPFLQSVNHENCETVMLKNNLCFGRCNSAHVPSTQEGLCSYCSHVKFILRPVQLKCAGDSSVTKVITMVEDCQCELRRGKHSHRHNGPGLIDPSLFGNHA